MGGMGKAAVALLGVMLAGHTAVLADQRPWVWTYGRNMMKPGEAELEHYLTLSSPDWSAREGNLRSVHQLELEIGMTPRLDVAIYQTFSRTPDGPLDWQGFKLRGRLRLLGEGSFAHPLLYAEVADNATLSDTALEFKLLLEEDWGPLRVALNPVLEQGNAAWEGGLNAALSWKVGPHLALGGEARLTEEAVRVGPAISHGGDGLWSALGASWPLGGADPGEITHEFRLILGVGLRP